MDALSLKWKHLVIQDLPEIPKIDNHVPVKEHFKMDQSMLANIKASHSKYNERLESNRKGTEGCVHKRIIEDAKETFRGDKKLRKIEMKKLEIAEQEKAISKKQAEAKLLVNQANTLIEGTESMRTFLNKERNILEKAEKQIQTSIIKSSCQKANRKSLLPVDDNNNEVENDSS